MTAKTKRNNSRKHSVRAFKAAAKSQDTRPDWSGHCDICGASPIVPTTGMCGPCTFGEADTAGGNW